MNIQDWELSKIKPYENNPRNNDAAVDKVAASIQEFGFKVPIIVDKDGVIIAGHTRLKAAEKLGLETAPVIVAKDLDEEQVKAFRLADNKTAEFAEWEFELMESELAEISEIDMSAFGNWWGQTDWFESREKNDREREEGNEEYNEFLEKFETKKTTDDCYTPDGVYEVVAEWVASEYGVDRKNFVRPFFPGGDYQREKYTEASVVVDNPPFSIMKEIIDWYTEKGIRFFLFAPCLALINYVDRATAICVQAAVEYENGALVPTSFLTNLETGITARTAPDLYAGIKKANDEYVKGTHRQIPKYKYPDEVVTAAMMGKWSHYDVEFSVRKNACEKIRMLDEQKEQGKVIYGCGLLLSEKAAAEKAAAEKAAAEKAAAEKAAAEKAAAEKAAAETWTLSAREREIVRRLSENDRA